MNVEGYPGLVVHGPLAASLLAELALEKNPGQFLKLSCFRLEHHYSTPHHLKLLGNQPIMA